MGKKSKTAPKNKAFQKIVKKQLENNRHILQSLREYDEGKKDISTDSIKKALGNL